MKRPLRIALYKRSPPILPILERQRKITKILHSFGEVESFKSVKYSWCYKFQTWELFSCSPGIPAWAVGNYCISLKVLKSPHKEIYSFKLTMLWLSPSSSAKYVYLCSMHTTTVAMWAPAPCCIDSTHAHVVLDSQSLLVFAFGDFPEQPEPHIEAQC